MPTVTVPSSSRRAHSWLLAYLSSVGVRLMFTFLVYSADLSHEIWVMQSGWAAHFTLPIVKNNALLSEFP
jgi:hypothetical protein